MSDAMCWVLRKPMSLHPGLTLHIYTNINELCVFDIAHISRRHGIFFLRLYFFFGEI